MMNFSDKIVTTIPLESVWTAQEELPAKRITYLTSEDITQLLKTSVLQFVVADAGDKLKWVDPNRCFDFWKNEAKQHIADNVNQIDLNGFADNYAYVASQWTTQDDIPIILLEKFH